MQEKHKNEIAKIINDFKPVDYTWPGFLVLLAVTEGYALPVTISNIWAKKISRKYQEEVEELEPIAENVKVGEKIDSKILELLNKLEKCAKRIKNKSDTSESDTSRLRTFKQGRGAEGMESYQYYNELQLHDNRSQVSNGARVGELENFSRIVKELYKAIISLPPESQTNFNLQLLEKIKTVAESEPDKLNKQLKILRKLLPSIIDHNSSGNKDTTQQKPEMVKKLVQIPDHPKLESTRKSKFAAAAMSAIAILVAYNPYFARMNIAEPYTLSLFNQAVKSNDPIAVDINEKIRLPTYKAIETGIIKAQQITAQIPGKFPLLPNPSANEGYDANQKKAPLTGDPREQSNSPIHNIIGQEAYQKYLTQNPENVYIPDSSVSILNRNTNNLEFIDQKDLNVNLLNKEETMSIMRPSPFDMGIIKHNEERGIDPIDVKLDTQSNRVFFKIQAYNADKNTKVFFDKYFFHPKLISLLDMDSFDAQGGNYMSIKVKKGNEVEIQKLFRKYKDHQGKYIRETKVESKLMKLSDIEIKTNPTNVDNYTFKLPGDFWIKYPDQIKHLMSSPNSESTDELPHKVAFDVKKENYQTVIKYFEQNGGINYYVHDTSSIGINDVDPIIGFYDTSHKHEIIDKHNLNYNAAPVNFDLSNPEEVKNNIPLGSFGIVYDFNKSSIAIPRFHNTSYSIIGVPVRVEDKLTYLLISQYFDEKEKINHYGKVLIIYTPDEEKLNLDQYLELDTRRNSTFVDDTKWVKDDSEFNKVVETLPQKLKEKIQIWREAAKNINNERDLESLVTEVREYIQNNNNYGKSDVLNKIINDSDFKVLPIFKALAENMEKTNKEKISCYTANFLEQVILSTMDMGVYINTGYADFDGDGILRANEGHAWTVVALRNDKGFHKLKIFDATPDRKLEVSKENSKEQFHYGPFVLVIAGGVLTIWLVNKAKKSTEDFEKLHTIEYPYPNNPPSKITELAKKLSSSSLHLVVSLFAHKKYSGELNLDSNSISSYIKNSERSKISDSWFDIDHLHKLTFTNAELKLVRNEYTKILLENSNPEDREVLKQLVNVICNKISLQNNLNNLRNFKKTV